MQLGFVVHDAGLSDMVQRFCNRVQSLRGPTNIAIGLCQEREPVRAFDLGADRAVSCEPLAKLGDALFALPLSDERPAAEYDRMSAEERNNFVRGDS